MRSARRLGFAITVAALSLAAACGGDDVMATADGAPADPDGGCVPGPDAGDTGAALGDVNGSWAVLERFTGVVTALNSTQIIRNVYVYDMTQTGTDIAITTRLCEIKVDDVGGLVQTRMLPALAQNLPALSRNGTLTADGAGFAFATEQGWVTRGVDLAMIETDTMPTMASDPRVVDIDADSKPGLTLLLDGVLRGQAYVVQRDWNFYTATQTSADRIDGLGTWSSEQIYLGSDPAAIADLNAVAQPDPDPSKHTVLLVRIPDGENCAYVLARQCSLFGGL